MTTAYITHPQCLLHEMTEGHPESPQRLWAINDALIQSRVMDLLSEVSAIKATKKQLCKVHSTTLFDSLSAHSPREGLFAVDPDTYMNRHSLEAAYYAAGAVVKASDLVMKKQASNAFCAVRPPGHHAERNQAMGFCLFNNIAVGVQHVLDEYRLQRIAILDFDVHHGNGTEDIFRNEERVLVCSSYQHPFYPYSGEPTISGHLINTPLEAGTNGESFRKAISREWWPQLHAFKPEMIFISAGFDAHKLDELAHLNLVEDDYAWITQEIMKIAKVYSQDRIVSSLEGGYHLNALANSVVAHIKALLNIY